MKTTTKIFNDNYENVLEQLIKNKVKVDAIITDLPFGTTQAKFDNELDYNKMWSLFGKVLKDEHSPIVLMIGGKGIFSLYNSNPHNFKYYWIVDKVYKTNHLNAKRQPLNEADMIFVFGNNGTPNYYPQLAKGIPNHSSGNLNNSNQTNNNYGIFHKVPSKRDGMKYPTNILRFDYGHPSIRIHHQQKPVALMEYLVKTYTLPGQTVLDITAGSGTVAIACKNLRRNSISIELNPKYFKVMEERLND